MAIDRRSFLQSLLALSGGVAAGLRLDLSRAAAPLYSGTAILDDPALGEIVLGGTRCRLLDWKITIDRGAEFDMEGNALGRPYKWNVQCAVRTGELNQLRCALRSEKHVEVDIRPKGFGGTFGGEVFVSDLQVLPSKEIRLELLGSGKLRICLSD